MNLDHNFVQVSKLSEDQKKRSSPKIEHFFPQIQVQTKKKQKKGLHQNMKHFFSPNSGKDQNKKKGLPKNGTLFFPNSDGTYAQMYTSVKLLGAGAYLGGGALGHGPPPFVNWAEALITQRVCFIRLFSAGTQLWTNNGTKFE